MSAAPAELTPVEVDEATQDFLRRLRALRGSGVHLFPVRHHSPACAHHLRRMIREVRPAAVLVEGPPELGGLLPLMRHADAQAPFAAYCAHEDAAGRHAAFYPFCEASPELVAVVEGGRVKAEVRFIDLPFGARRGPKGTGRGGRRRLRSLLDEAHLARSAYLAALARRTGCRDQDELWDHLFEARPATQPWARFVDDVGAYCLMARRDQPTEVLEADGSLPRERAMTFAVREARAQGDAIVVVTGGFHTPQIAAWLEDETPLEAPPAPTGAPVLIRYGFVELDALNGYGAGMPAPAYQDALAAAYAGEVEAPQLEAAGAMLVEVARAARRTQAAVANAADEVAALVQAQRLAELRGRGAITRSDLQEALLSTLSKGPADAEGALVARLVRRTFTGRLVGRVPAEAGQPPIVEDFRRRAAELKVEAGAVAREVALSLYQRAPHRAASRFLHALAFLEVPYGVCLAGPDFVAGEGLHRRQEKWRLRWTPDVERGLVEASVHGATVEQAAAGRLEEAIRGLTAQGQGRDAEQAVTLLMQALAMGAEGSLEALAPEVSAALAADPRLERVVAALITLVLGLEGREPLEAFRADVVPRLATEAFERTCRLLPDVGRVPAARVDPVVSALASLRQLAATEAVGGLADRLGAAIEAAARLQDADPKVQGVLTGLAYGFGRIGPEAVAARVRGHLLGTGADPEAKVALLAGVLEAAREIAWRVPEIVEGLDALLAGWDEPTFMRALPALRLAFAALTPREADRVAAAVPGALRLEADPPAEAAPAANAPALDPAVDEAVQEALRGDGLAAWGAP